MTHKLLSNRKFLVIIGLSLLTLVAATALPVAAQDPTSIPGPAVPSISVSGMGQAFGAPDVAYIQMGVDIVNTDVGAAVTEANDVMNTVIQAISESGVAPEDVRTTNFNVYSDFFNPQTGEQTAERQYHVQNMVTVTVRDVSQVSAVIDAGLTAGANSVFGLNFGIADPTGLEQEARLEAIENARDRAQKLADAMGVTLGEPIVISETFGGGIPFAFEAQAGLGGGGAPPITGGQLSVSVQVNVTFAIGE